MAQCSMGLWLIFLHLFLCIFKGFIRLEGWLVNSWPSWENIRGQSSIFSNFCIIFSVWAQIFPEFTWNHRSHPSSLIEHGWKYKNEHKSVSYSLREHCAMAKCMFLRCKIADFHGCHGYHGNGCHGYKENIEFISKQSFLLIHSYHQVHGFYGCNW